MNRAPITIGAARSTEVEYLDGKDDVLYDLWDEDSTWSLRSRPWMGMTTFLAEDHTLVTAMGTGRGGGYSMSPGTSSELARDYTASAWVSVGADAFGRAVWVKDRHRMRFGAGEQVGEPGMMQVDRPGRKQVGERHEMQVGQVGQAEVGKQCQKQVGEPSEQRPGAGPIVEPSDAEESEAPQMGEMSAHDVGIKCK